MAFIVKRSLNDALLSMFCELTMDEMYSEDGSCCLNNLPGCGQKCEFHGCGHCKGCSLSDSSSNSGC